MEKHVEHFEVVADSMAAAIERLARECKSAAVVGLTVSRGVTYPEPTYEVEITKVRSASGARSLDRVERWQTERAVLLRKADELIRRLARIEARAETLAQRLRDADAEYDDSYHYRTRE